MSRAATFELSAQSRNDLSAQNFHLLKRHFQGKACMINEKDLPLVVSDGICIAEVAVDNLLGRADGQRCDALELLQ